MSASQERLRFIFLKLRRMLANTVTSTWRHLLFHSPSVLVSATVQTFTKTNTLRNSLYTPRFAPTACGLKHQAVVCGIPDYSECSLHAVQQSTLCTTFTHSSSTLKFRCHQYHHPVYQFCFSRFLIPCVLSPLSYLYLAFFVPFWFCK
jgi:hypothetical protein